MWKRVGCPNTVAEGNITLTDGPTSYDITGLEEDSSYNITVKASNAAGCSTVANTLTPEVGEKQ